MSDQNPADIPQGCGKNDPSSKASEILKSRVITAYEQALRDGLTPLSALKVMLDWAAQECGRVGTD